MCQNGEAMSALVVQRDELRRLRDEAERQRNEANRRIARLVDAVRGAADLLGQESAGERVIAEHLRSAEGDMAAAELVDCFAWGIERARCEFLRRAAIAAVAPLTAD